jgi:DNA-binding transcriptional MerR regulator
VYGQPEIERLHAILSLKQLGLPLARIAELFKGGPTDLAALLSMQERALNETRRKTDHALDLIKIAKVHIKKRGKLTAPELSALVDGISKTVIRMTPDLEEMARRAFAGARQPYPDRSVEMDPKSAARASAAWQKMFADLDALLPKVDPLSKKGLAIGRRMFAMIKRATGGDKELWNNSYRFWKEAVSDPRTAKHMPMTQAHWDFLSKAMTELQRRGELKL